MKLIVGLGNPGGQYMETRHNVGYWVVTALVERAHGTFSENKKLQAFEAKLDTEILVLKPTTFMNQSGGSVQKAMQFYKIAPEDVLVIRDDIDMEVGKVRQKIESGSGGHRGVQDIINSIGNKFTQLKIGVGRPSFDHDEVSDSVLEKPTEEEHQKLMAAVAEALLLVNDWLDPV